MGLFFNQTSASLSTPASAIPAQIAIICLIAGPGSMLQYPRSSSPDSTSMTFHRSPDSPLKTCSFMWKNRDYHRHLRQAAILLRSLPRVPAPMLSKQHQSRFGQDKENQRDQSTSNKSLVITVSMRLLHRSAPTSVHISVPFIGLRHSKTRRGTVLQISRACRLQLRSASGASGIRREHRGSFGKEPTIEPSPRLPRLPHLPCPRLPPC